MKPTQLFEGFQELEAGTRKIKFYPTAFLKVGKWQFIGES
jgi:hypothetical protein